MSIIPQNIRKIILEQSKRANVGHIGSALSVADIISVLYSNILRVDSFNDPKRDRFILSKGHAALALYAAFFLKGWITEEQLNTYCTDNTLLGVHPEHFLEGVEFSTGSLGMGMCFAAGEALASRIKGEDYRVFVLVSDAELNEGSFWEAVMFAAQHKLSNLVVIVDFNGQQALGYTKDVLNPEPILDRFKAFNWQAKEIDGNDENVLSSSLNSIDYACDQPKVIIAKTVFGKGVSYMENKIKWHYWPMSDNEYNLALEEVVGSK